MRAVFIEPAELWEYCEEILENDELRGSMYKIAENEDCGIEIWVEADLVSVYFVVEIDNVEIYRAHVYDKSDAELTAEWLYENFLNYGENGDETIVAQKIEERECELDNAFIDLVKAIMAEAPKKIVDDVKEHTLEYLAKEWGIDIYRPSILVDTDTGEECYTEFPYDDMYYI